MNDPNSKRKLVEQAFQNGLQTPISDKQYHYVDDDGFLLDLSLGEISESSRSNMLKHLAGCSYCRHELARMIEAGVLPLPQISESSDDGQVVSLVNQRAAFWDTKRILLSVAAAVMLLVGASMYLLPANNDLSLALNDLAANRYLSALKRAEGYLASDSDDVERRKQAKEILQDAAYQQSVKSLAMGDFELVTEVTQRAETATGRSPRLLNVQVQAMRKQATPSAWSNGSQLTQFGYQLDGRSYAKQLPDFDESVKAILSEYERAITEFPNDAQLRLNYGQYLLELGDTETASAQFAAAQRLAPSATTTHMALGVAAFQANEFDLAIGQFRAVLNTEPDNVDAMLNLAISYMRVDQKETAATWYAKVRDLLPTGERRQQIQQFIDQLNQPN